LSAVSFSLFFFSSDSEQNVNDKYGALLDIAEFADARGFAAIWTPERHFHRFGGLFPNPSVLSAAIAARTKRIRIRAGSVQVPLHHPLRVAEDWAIVDNISGGRVDIAFTSGWHPRDYVFAPELFPRRRELLFERVDMLRRLWRGEQLPFTSGFGETVSGALYPAPIQPELPVWITTSRTPETWTRAGAIGANILTALYAIDRQTLAANIAAYREARRQHGHSAPGTVSVMLHTFLGADADQVRETVRQPLIDYILQHTELYDLHEIAVQMKLDPGQLTEKHRRMLAKLASDRYFKTSSLIGTPASCAAMVDSLAGIGVNEIACLIDFGIRHEDVLTSLALLDQLQMQYV